MPACLPSWLGWQLEGLGVTRAVSWFPQAGTFLWLRSVIPMHICKQHSLDLFAGCGIKVCKLETGQTMAHFYLLPVFGYVPSTSAITTVASKVEVSSEGCLRSSVPVCIALLTSSQLEATRLPSIYIKCAKRFGSCAPATFCFLLMLQWQPSQLAESIYHICICASYKGC